MSFGSDLAEVLLGGVAGGVGGAQEAAKIKLMGENRGSRHDPYQNKFDLVKVILQGLSKGNKNRSIDVLKSIDLSGSPESILESLGSLPNQPQTQTNNLFNPLSVTRNPQSTIQQPFSTGSLSVTRNPQSTIQQKKKQIAPGLWI